MAINNSMWSYGELQFINSTASDNTPEWSYGEVSILYEGDVGPDPVVPSGIYVAVDNTWELAKHIWINDNGKWKYANNKYVNVDGTWKVMI